jgi:hypothetical protein
MLSPLKCLRICFWSGRATSASPLSPSFCRGFIRGWLRTDCGREAGEKGVPPFQGGSIFPLRFRRETQVSQGVCKLRSVDHGCWATWRPSVQRGLHGEDAAQLIADPSGYAHGLAAFFHGRTASGIQCLLAWDAITVAFKHGFLQAGTEECGEEERWGCWCPPLALPIEAFKICVYDGQVMTVSTEPPAQPREKGSKESACVHQAENRPRSAKQEELQYFFIEPPR